MDVAIWQRPKSTKGFYENFKCIIILSASGKSIFIFSVFQNDFIHLSAFQTILFRYLYRAKFLFTQGRV